MKEHTYLVALILVIATMASARDIIVPGDETSLQNALSVAERGDRILLRAGYYHISETDLVSYVTIEGNASDPSSVIIDGQNQGRVFRAEGVSGARLVGLTITGGKASGETRYESSGGGLFVSYSQVTLESVIFSNNTATTGGGAVRVSGDEARLQATGCLFLNNTAIKGGGGVNLSYGGYAQFMDCDFRGNSASWGGAISVRTLSLCHIIGSTLTGNTAVEPRELGGGFFADNAAEIMFLNCVLAANSAREGGAARLTSAESSFQNCTIDGNAAWELGAGFMTMGGSLTIDHTIISFNQGEAFSTVYTDINAQACDIFGNPGGDWTGPLEGLRDMNGNLSADPKYCGSGIYNLQEDSPCAEANSGVGLIGALPAGCENVGLILESFTAEFKEDAIKLNWTVSDAAAYEFRLQGRSHSSPSSPAWYVDYEGTNDPNAFEATDHPPVDAGSIEYLLEARTATGNWIFLGELLVAMVTDISTPDFALGDIYPNPFNPRVNINFMVNKTMHVVAEVYNVRGQRIKILQNGMLDAGRHDLSWDSRDEAGQTSPTGTYLLRIMAGNKEYRRKMLLLK